MFDFLLSVNELKKYYYKCNIINKAGLSDLFVILLFAQVCTELLSDL